MAEPLWTASASERVDACAASAALPRTAKPPDEHAERGSRGHDFMQIVIERGREAALEAAPANMREQFAGIDVAALPVPPESMAAEVAFAYDPGTGRGRELGRGIRRGYAVAPGEIAGTADAVGVSQTAVMIPDFKFGYQAPTPAAQNGQLRTLALMAARAYGRDTAIVEIVRINPDGRIWRDRATFDAFDLDAIESELRDTWTRVMHAVDLVDAGEAVATAIGPHCRYCPSLRHCPGQTALVRQVCGDGSGIDKPISSDQLVAAYHKIQAAKRILAEVESSIYAQAAQSAIDLGDGTILGPVTTTRRELVGSVVRDVLTEMHGAEVADKGCQVESTQTAIEEALRSVSGPGELAKAKRRVMAEIERRGGVTVRESTTIKPRRADKQLTAKSEAA